MTKQSPAPSDSRSSLANQLTAWLVIKSFILLVVTATLLSWGTIAALNWADDQVAEKRLETVRGFLQVPKPDREEIEHEVTEDNQGPRQIFIRVLTDSREFSLATPNFPEVLRPEAFPDVSTLPFGEKMYASIADKENHYRVATARIAFAVANSKDAVIQVAIDTSQDQPALRWYRTLAATVLAGALAASALSTHTVVRRKLAPLGDIARETSKIRSTTLDKRLDISGLPAELYELGQYFNDMLQRLESTYKGLRQYSDDIAHELRSPLNRMLLNGEVTLARDRSPEDIRAALAFNIDECRQLVELIETLLFVARAENKQMALNRQEIDVGKELGEIVAYFEAAASEKGISIRLAPCGGDHPRLDRTLFRRAVSNIVNNAIAHTPEGGRIVVSAGTENDKLRVSVRDSGKGISPVDLPHVLDRFYRSDRARSFDRGRIGLGLAIVKSIVELHGGKVAIESAPGEGTRVDLIFADA